jgi:hypothetical protein
MLAYHSLSGLEILDRLGKILLYHGLWTSLNVAFGETIGTVLSQFSQLDLLNVTYKYDYWRTAAENESIK